MAKTSIRVDITGDADSLKRAFNSANSSAGKFGSSMAKVGKMAAVGLAVGVGVAAVAAVKFAKAALDAEKSQTRLDSAFKHATGSAKDRAAAMKAVSTISNKAGLDDEALADTLARLTQATGSVTQAQAGMAVAADVARGRGIELEAATGIVTKAMLGNVGALKRIGIEIPKVTAAQDELRESGGKVSLEQMKAAKTADDLATRQAALAALQKKFGGDAEAYGKTASGAMDRFKVAIENVEEGLGAALLPTLGRVAGGVADFLTKFNNASGASAKFKVVLDEVKSLATQSWTALKAAFNAIDWAKIWDSVMQKFKSVDWNAEAREIGKKVTEAFNHLSEAIARVDWNKVGKAIGDGIKRGAQILASVDWGALIVGYMRLQVRVIAAIATALVGIGQSLLSGLSGVIQNAASAAGLWAMSIGRNVAAGIVSGIGDLASSFAGAIIGKLSDAKDRVLGWAGIKSPSTLFAAEIGEPIALGIAMGVATTGGKITEELEKSLQKAMDRAKQVIENNRGRFTQAWDTLAGSASSAFDAIYGELRTPAEKQLALIQKTEDEKARLKAVADAKAAVAEATDAQARLDAQEQLRQAELAITIARLEEQAAVQRKNLDARIAMRKEHFDKALGNLQESLAKEGATHAEAHKAIMALFKKFGINYENAGEALGTAFAAGLRSKVKAVEAAAMALAKAAARPIELHSPAEIGPLAKLDHFWDKFVSTLVRPLDVSGLSSTVSGAVKPAPASGGSLVPAMGGVAATTINVTVNGVVGNGEAVANEVRRHLYRIQNRNGSLGFT